MQPDSTQYAAPAAPTPLAYVPTSRNEVIKVIALGVIVGLLVPALSTLIANYFISPVFCNGPDTFSVCASGGVIANHIAAAILAVIAFIVLTQWSVYRALVLVIAATLAMWGLKKYADPLTSGSWIEYYLFSGLLYGLAYALFYWLLRLRNFIVSIIAVVVAAAIAAWAVVA
jgi:hypothetical protein